MKKNIIYLSLLAFAALAFSCSKDDGVSNDVVEDDDNGGTGGGGTTTTIYDITFTTSLESMTGIGNDLLADGAGVMIFNGEQTKSYKYSSSDGKLTSDDPFQIDRSVAYPYVGFITSDTTFFASESYSFSAAEDQSSSLVSSDLIVGATAAATNGIAPDMPFAHAMSSIVITIKHDSYSSTDSGELSVNAKKSISYTFADKSIASSGDASIKAYYAGDDKYIAIFAPQSFTSGTTIATFSDPTGGISSFDLTFDAAQTFDSGEQRSYTYDVLANTLTFTSSVINGWQGGVTGGSILGVGMLPTPDVTAAPGHFRAAISWAVATDEVDDVIVYIDGVPVDTVAYTSAADTWLIGEDTLAAKSYSIGVVFKGDKDSGGEEVSYGKTSIETAQTISVYDLDEIALSYTTAIRVPYVDIVETSGAKIYWTSTFDGEDAAVTVKYSGGEVEVTSTTYESTLSDATAGEQITIISEYSNDEVSELPSNALDPLVTETPYTLTSVDYGQRFGEGSKSSSYSTLTYSGTAATAAVGGDFTETATYAATQAWDATYLNTTLTGTNANGFHSGADGGGRTLTLDLGAEYDLTTYAYWQRRWNNTVLYHHINPKKFRVWGATAAASDDNGATIKSEYQAVTGEGLADWTTMGDKWNLLVDMSTNEDTAPDSSDRFQMCIPGHYFDIDCDVAIRYIRIEFIEAWNGGNNHGFCEFDFWYDAD